MLSTGQGLGFEVSDMPVSDIYKLNVDLGVGGNKESKKRLNEYQVTHGIDESTVQHMSHVTLRPWSIKFACVPDTDWRCDVYIDGTYIDYEGVWFKRDEEYRIESVRNMQNGKLVKSSLIFLPLTTTSEKEEVTLTSEDIKSLGTIVIKLTPGTWVRDRAGPARGVQLTHRVGDEKAKKFAQTTSCPSLSMSDVAAPKTMGIWNFTPNLSLRAPYRFIFNYRSEIVLKKMRVIESPKTYQEMEVPGETETASHKDSAGGSPTQTKKKVPATMFADAIDLTNSADKQSKKRKLAMFLKNAVEIDEKEDLSGPANPGSLKRIQLLGEENHALRDQIRRLQMGQRIEEQAVDLTLGHYDSE
uniref:DUF7918 domain-containing protein n=1 Tax=Kwoniella dejecticola CBS 10117 TaxID=1296121 RepID=A0A1A6AA28_9TREE|nr:uncharacterized protein I303_02932 [Kwoniella dejecticola CBS 10117]OBR86911.1 hypothetical protein I303_02932 [Kwoniella dejecticola CBS 10117]